MAKGVVRRRPKPKEKGSDSEVPQFKYLYSYAQAAPPACTFEPNGLSLVTVWSYAVRNAGAVEVGVTYLTATEDTFGSNALAMVHLIVVRVT
jgi:hypothetical protein